MSNRAPTLLGSLLVLMVTACSGSPTQLDSSHLEPEFAGRQIRSVLVVGIAAQPQNRVLFEDEFAGELESRGVAARTSYTTLGEGVEPEADRIVAALEGSDVDAVLVTHVVLAELSVHESPQVVPYASERLWGYQDQTTYQRQDLSSVEEEVVLESNLYDLATTELMWTARTRSFNPGTARDLIDQLATVLMADLQGHGLLD